MRRKFVTVKLYACEIQCAISSFGTRNSRVCMLRACVHTLRHHGRLFIASPGWSIPEKRAFYQPCISECERSPRSSLRTAKACGYHHHQLFSPFAGKRSPLRMRRVRLSDAIICSFRRLGGRRRCRRRRRRCRRRSAVHLEAPRLQSAYARRSSPICANLYGSWSAKYGIRRSCWCVRVSVF